MSNPFAKFDTDNSAETSGVWQDYGEFKVKVRRAGKANKAYTKKITAWQKANGKKLELDLVSEEESQKVVREIYAQTIVNGWQTKVEGKFVDGIFDLKTKNVVPYTWEGAVNTFRKYPDLMQEIAEVANNMANYRVAEQEEDSGN